jgi:4-hydroxymandelate oxidase
VFTLSTLSNSAVEDVCAAATGPVWFQLYVYKDRGATEGLVQRAREAGCSALVLTVDAPLLGNRERDVHNRFHLPAELKVENLLPKGYGDVREEAGASGLSTYVNSMMDQSLTWKDLEWLRSVTDVPILVKGVVRPDDAVRAVEHGASGVIVSNHGGRQLDTAPATVEALPVIVDALQGRGEVLLDGGVRRGTDVVKALALGARAVMVGRPVLWGLAVDGEAGAKRVLELLRHELDLAMALCGCPTVGAVGRELVWGESIRSLERPTRRL